VVHGELARAAQNLVVHGKRGADGKARVPRGGLLIACELAVRPPPLALLTS